MRMFLKCTRPEVSQNYNQSIQTILYKKDGFCIKAATPTKNSKQFRNWTVFSNFTPN